VHSEKRVRAVFFCVRLSVQDTIRPHGIFVAFCGGAKSRRKRPRGGIRRAGQTAELRRKGAAPDKSGKRYRWAEVVPGCGGGPSGKKGRRNRLRGGRRAVLLVSIGSETRRTRLNAVKAMFRWGWKSVVIAGRPQSSSRREGCFAAGACLRRPLRGRRAFALMKAVFGQTGVWAGGNGRAKAGARVLVPVLPCVYGWERAVK